MQCLLKIRNCFTITYVKGSLLCGRGINFEGGMKDARLDFVPIWEFKTFGVCRLVLN